jgi:hypothetical protein
MAEIMTTVMYWAVSITLCCLAVESLIVVIPSCNAAVQDALNGAAVELFEDLRVHAKSFQPPEWEEMLSFPLHN